MGSLIYFSNYLNYVTVAIVYNMRLSQNDKTLLYFIITDKWSIKKFWLPIKKLLPPLKMHNILLFGHSLFGPGEIAKGIIMVAIYEGPW